MKSYTLRPDTVTHTELQFTLSGTTVTRRAIPADDSTPSAWARYNVTGVVHLYVGSYWRRFNIDYNSYSIVNM